MLLSGRGPSKTELTAFDGTLASKKYVPYKRRGDLVLACHQWKLIMSFAKKKAIQWSYNSQTGEVNDIRFSSPQELEVEMSGLEGDVEIDFSTACTTCLFY